LHSLIGHTDAQSHAGVSDGYLAGVAFPEERLHSVEGEKVKIAVERLGVVVWWVTEHGEVKTEVPAGVDV
jgi:hypothetical protein